MSRLRRPDDARPRPVPNLQVDAERNTPRPGIQGDESPEAGQAAALTMNGLRVIVSRALPPDSMMLVNEHAIEDWLHRRCRGDAPKSFDPFDPKDATALAVDTATYHALLHGIG